MHYCEVNSLVASMHETWGNGHLDKSIDNMFYRLKRMLHLIDEGKESIEFMETKYEKNITKQTYHPWVLMMKCMLNKQRPHQI